MLYGLPTLIINWDQRSRCLWYFYKVQRKHPDVVLRECFITFDFITHKVRQLILHKFLTKLYITSFIRISSNTLPFQTYDTYSLGNSFYLYDCALYFVLNTNRNRIETWCFLSISFYTITLTQRMFIVRISSITYISVSYIV